MGDIFYYLGLIDYNEKKYNECIRHMSICLLYNEKK